MLGHELFADVSERLTADLRLRYPSLEARFTQSEVGWSLELRDDRTLWGSVGSWLDGDDVVESREVEHVIAQLVEDAVNNLWPDADVLPWPPCPLHPDHPLQFGMAGGRAAWYCSREATRGYPLGSLERLLSRGAQGSAD